VRVGVAGDADADAVAVAVAAGAADELFGFGVGEEKSIGLPSLSCLKTERMIGKTKK